MCEPMRVMYLLLHHTKFCCCCRHHNHCHCHHVVVIILIISVNSSASNCCCRQKIIFSVLLIMVSTKILPPIPIPLTSSGIGTNANTETLHAELELKRTSVRVGHTAWLVSMCRALDHRTILTFLSGICHHSPFNLLNFKNKLFACRVKLVLVLVNSIGIGER